MRSRLQSAFGVTRGHSLFTGAVSAGEIQVMTSGAFTGACMDLKPAFELGPLPDAVQKISIFSAGISAHSGNPDAARELIRFLASPESARAVSRSGLEPIAAY
jgi:ABC-type molybdate transport system substrate-binding protein